MGDQANTKQIEGQLVQLIVKGDITNFKAFLAKLDGSINFVDESGMSPLQQACYKGKKEFVQLCLDQGADVHFSQHVAKYTPLHFAALSGNVDVVLLLLEHGAELNELNSVHRTPAQMAAFVGNHQCAATLNNYIKKSELEYYIQIHGEQTEPYLPPYLLDYFHKFVIQVNLHPVRIALNIQKLGNLSEHLHKIKKVLQLMSEKEMHNKFDTNELMAFKYHYLSWIVAELIRCQDQFISRKEQGGEMRHNFIELFAKRVLKENKLGQLDYLEYTIRDCVREFPFRECILFRKIVTELAIQGSMPALDIIKTAINGQRFFDADTVSNCSSCGEEKPDKKCSKCKEVQYCDRQCQRLHWFIHKKTCARPTSANTSTNIPQNSANQVVDSIELSEEIKKVVCS